MLYSGRMTKIDSENTRKEFCEKSFATRFKCFESHGGIRKKELSTIIAPYGMGKSTLVRTIVSEIIKQHKRVYLFLSEESPEFYKLPIYSAFEYGFRYTSTDPNIFLENLFLESQLEMQSKEKSLGYFLNNLEQIILTYDVELIILDNITTSFLGRGSVNQQAETAEKLKELASKYGVAIVAVVHTAKGTNPYQTILTGEDVRGNATITNIGSYNYVLTTYFRLNIPRAFLSVDKARYHPQANKRVYELIYNHNTSLFDKDVESSYEIMQSIINALRRRYSGVMVEI